MRNAIKNLLDLDEPPTWIQILLDLAGTGAVFLIPAAITLVAVAFGWDRP
jgi:hypothetical protein